MNYQKLYCIAAFFLLGQASKQCIPSCSQGHRSVHTLISMVVPNHHITCANSSLFFIRFLAHKNPPFFYTHISFLLYKTSCLFITTGSLSPSVSFSTTPLCWSHSDSANSGTKPLLPTFGPLSLKSSCTTQVFPSSHEQDSPCIFASKPNARMPKILPLVFSNRDLLVGRTDCLILGGTSPDCPSLNFQKFSASPLI